jgi:hypothetical protein
MEGGLSFVLIQLGHRGYADTKMICHHVQRELFPQIDFYLVCDLIQQGILSCKEHRDILCAPVFLVHWLSLLCKIRGGCETIVILLYDFPLFFSSYHFSRL